jgi:hypothetical protein
MDFIGTGFCSQRFLTILNMRGEKNEVWALGIIQTATTLGEAWILL